MPNDRRPTRLPRFTTRSPRPAGPPVPAQRAVSHCRVFRDGKRVAGEFTPARARAEVAAHGGFVWLALQEPDETQMQQVASEFGIDELIVEDAVAAHQRPKAERYDDQLFLVVRPVVYARAEDVSDSRDIISTAEIQTVIGRDFVLTVHHGPEVPGLSRRLDGDLELNDPSPLSLVWALTDHVVELDRKIMGRLEDAVDRLEEEVFAPVRNTTIEPVYQFKREVLEARHAVTPFTSALKLLIQNNRDLMDKQQRSYFRDVLDNTQIAADSTMALDERLSALIDAGTAKVSMQQNQDMRRLSALVGMVTVPTLIAGIYGMNFDDMPELHWTFGYPLALGLMALSVAVIYWYCKRSGWL